MSTCNKTGRCVLTGLLAVWLPGLVACGLIDLRPVVVSLVPQARNAVLASVDTPLEVTFPAAVDKLAAEQALTVSGGQGTVRGEYSWDGDTCRFHPETPWQPTVAYRWQLKGQVPLLDGRVARLDYDIRFFAVSDRPAPRLAAYSPAHGARATVFPAVDAFVRLEFSQAMDQASVEAAFSLRPAAECAAEWQADGLAVVFRPKLELQPCQLYRWTLGVSAKALDGAPLLREESAAFLTDLDSQPPSLLRVYPLRQVGGLWQESLPGATADDFETGDAVGLQFSEPVRPESVTTAIRLEPTLNGRLERLADDLYAYLPQRPFDPAARFELVVGTGLTDRSGLRPAAESRHWLGVRFPWLSLSRLTGNDEISETWENPAAGAILPVSLEAPDGQLRLLLDFNVDFSPEAAIAAFSRVNLAGYFPAATSGGVAVRRASWTTQRQLAIDFEGLLAGSGGIVNYYKLTLSGGSGGLENGAGSRFEESLVLYLEIKP